MNTMNHESACRKLLHFVADDLAIPDQYSERNPIDLTREIRGAIAAKNRRIAELEAALDRVCADYQRAVDEMAQHGVYPSADVAAHFGAEHLALDALLAQAELKGWQRRIDAVRGSVKGYPNQGGDTVIMAAIDKLLAGAKREAIEAAADKAKTVGDSGVGRFPTLTEGELRRMEREVKP